MTFLNRFLARPAIPRFAPALALSLLLLIASTPTAQAEGCVPLPPYGTEADRIGFNVVTDYGKSFLDYDVDYFGAGWFIDYRPSQYLGSYASPPASLEPVAPTAFEVADTVLLPLISSALEDRTITHGMGYMHVLRAADLDGNWRTFVNRLLADNPGMLWVIGNEPDRDLQDSITPAQYAVLYHDVYEYIKQKDPTSQIAIAGVVQPTPLRRRYLDMALNAYLSRYGKPMPIDVWNVHAFILRETNEWGAGVPLGLEAYAQEAMLYEVPDHGDIKILKQLIRDFRTWMAARGYRNTPLIVSEYGILMAPDYDAGNGRVYDHEFISEYMRSSFDFFRTAVNSNTGYPGDGNRLVQAWSWFGLNNYVYSYPDREYGFNGNLADHDSGEITPLGRDFAQYAAVYDKDYADLAFRLASISRTQVPAGAEGVPVAVKISVYNRGNVDVHNSLVRFWLGDPDNGGALLEAHAAPEALPPRCRDVWDMEVNLRLPALTTGFHNLFVEIVGATGEDPISANDRKTFVLEVGDTSDFERVHLPYTTR